MSAEVTTFCHLTFYFPVVSSRLQEAFTVARKLKATRLNYSASLAGGALSALRRIINGLQCGK